MSIPVILYNTQECIHHIYFASPFSILEIWHKKQKFVFSFKESCTRKY